MNLIEKKVAALASHRTRSSPGRKGWRTTFGLSKDDPEFEGMIRLGREYRNHPDHNDDRARS